MKSNRCTHASNDSVVLVSFLRAFARPDLSAKSIALIDEVLSSFVESEGFSSPDDPARVLLLQNWSDALREDRAVSTGLGSITISCRKTTVP